MPQIVRVANAVEPTDAPAFGNFGHVDQKGKPGQRVHHGNARYEDLKSERTKSGC